MAYTASMLADFVVVKLGATGVALGLTVTSSAVVEAVNDVSAVLGVSDVADLTDDLKTRTVAEWQAWRTAKGAAAGQYDLKAGSSSLTRSQFFDHIAAMLADSEVAALRYSEVADALSGAATAVVSATGTADSPYGYAPWRSEF